MQINIIFVWFNDTTLGYIRHEVPEISVIPLMLLMRNCREQRFINRLSVNDLVDSDITVISAATKKQNKFRGKRLGIFAQQSTTFSLEGVVKLAH